MQYDNPLFKFNYRTGEWEVDTNKLDEIFGEPAPDGVIIPPPFKVSTNKQIIGKTALQQTIILQLEHQASPETATSARSLARQQHSVLAVEMRPGRVKAFMMGGSHYSWRYQSQWFSPHLEFPVLNEVQQKQVLEALTGQIDSLASLMKGELPVSAAQIFQEAGVDLLHPRKLHCSCRNQPCPHSLALAYVMVAILNESPFHTLLLHGITPPLIAQGLAEKQLLPDTNSMIRSMWASGIMPAEIESTPNLRGQLLHLPVPIHQDLMRIFDATMQQAADALRLFPAPSSDLQALYPPLPPLPFIDDQQLNLNSRGRAALAEIDDTIERLCASHLDAEYQRLATYVVRQFVQQDPKAITTGNRWGSGFLFHLLRLNQWYLPGERELATEQKVVPWLGASQPVLRKYAQTIQNTLQLSPTDPRYAHSYMRPYAAARRWLLRRGNQLVDYRTLPPAEQAEVQERGLLGIMLEYA